MDVGTMTSATSAAVNSYATKETKQADDVKKYNVTGKTIGQPKLSEQAKKYYEELKAKFQNMDFILVSSDMKEMAKASAGSFANPYKTVVLVDEEKIERMAVDEAYRMQYENLILAAQKKLPELSQTMSSVSNVKGFGVQINDNGTTSFFAVMQKSFDRQAAMIEERRAEKREEKKAAEKKAEKEERLERLEQKRAQKKEDVVIISANSIEELRKKVEDYNDTLMLGSVKTEAEKLVGTVIDFKG